MTHVVRRPRACARVRTVLLACALLAGCGGAGAPREAPRAPDSVDEAANILLRRRTIAALRALPLEARADEVFGALYNELEHAKPCDIDQAELERRLATESDRAATRGPWHVRWGIGGTADLDADARRLYFDVLPASAGALADFVVAALDGRGVARYSFKVLSSLETFDVPVAAVLYVEGADYAAAREVALAFVATHADALWPEVPPLTRRLGPGLSAADEPGRAGPPGVAGNSFGGAMAHVIALALSDAPDDLDVSTLAGRVRAALEQSGFDPARPWLRPGRTDDDL